MKKQALLIGNSINQLGAHISWTKMLEDIVKKMGKRNTFSFSHKPYPLLYEEIFTRGARYAGFNEKSIREEVEKGTNQIAVNNYHRQLMDLPFENILTTNYDYCLEKSIAETFTKDKENEKKYSLFRKRMINNNKSVWHIHGEVNYKQSIMLGYEHYMGAVQKMRNYLTSHIEVKRQILNDKTGKTESTKLQWKSPFKKGIVKFENEEYYSWIDIFLRDDIHIVGFGLKFEEVDLWWLISYRNRRMIEKDMQCGKLYYYYFDKGNDDDEGKAKLDMLKILGVENIKIDLNRIQGEWDYEEGWAKLLSKLKSLK